MATKEFEVGSDGTVSAQIAGGDLNNRADLSYKPSENRAALDLSAGKALNFKFKSVKSTQFIFSFGGDLGVSSNLPGTSLAQAERNHAQDSSINYIDTPINPRTTIGFYPALNALQQIGRDTHGSFDLNKVTVGEAVGIVNEVPILNPSDQKGFQNFENALTDLKNVNYVPPAGMPKALAQFEQGLASYTGTTIPSSVTNALLTPQNAGQVVSSLTLGQIDAAARWAEIEAPLAQAAITRNGGQQGITQDIEQPIDARLTSTANQLLALANQPVISAADIQKAAGAASTASTQIAGILPAGVAAGTDNRLTASVNSLLADAQQSKVPSVAASDLRKAAAALTAQIPNVNRAAAAIGAEVPKIQSGLATVASEAQQVTKVDSQFPSPSDMQKYDREATEVGKLDPQVKAGAHVALAETGNAVNAAVVAQGAVAAGVNNVSYTAGSGKGMQMTPAEIESGRVEVGHEFGAGGNGSAGFSKATGQMLNLPLEGDRVGVYGYAQEAKIAWRGSGESMKSTEFGVGVNATKSLGEQAVGYVAAEAYAGHTMENLTPGSTPFKPSDKGVGIKFGIKF